MTEVLDALNYAPDWFWPALITAFAVAMGYVVLQTKANARHMVSCPHCGAVADDRRACPKCGRKDHVVGP